MSLTYFAITFAEGKDLLGKDLNGKSDPYVLIPKDQIGIFGIPKKGLKTHKKKNTLNPIWNQTFELQCNPKQTNKLIFEVYDYDFIGSDDFLGKGEINLEWMANPKFKFYEDLINLYRIKKNKTTKQMETKYKGQVHIIINIRPGPLPMPNTMVQTVNILQPGTWIPINEDIVNIGLGWDFNPGDTFDLDGSITAFDIDNNPIESIYYSHLSGINGAILHHGDNLTGKGEGDDEIITINLDFIPISISSLAIAINSFKSNSLIRAKSAYIRIFTNSTGIGRYILARTKDCIGLLLGVLERNPQIGKWYFNVMCDPIEGNVITKSYESIKTLLNSYNSTFNTQTINLKIKLHPLPNENIFINDSWIPIDNQFTYVGLGWDVLKGYTFDLDSGIIAFDINKNVRDVIYHKCTTNFNGSIKHFGDNKTGAGDGDDEIISINFPNLDVNYDCLAVILNSYKGNPLIGIKSGFIRLFDNKKPIGIYMIEEGINSTGILLGIFRINYNTRQWFFHVMIEPIYGVIATESVENVKSVIEKYQLIEINKIKTMEMNNNNINDGNNNINNINDGNNQNQIVYNNSMV